MSGHRITLWALAVAAVLILAGPAAALTISPDYGAFSGDEKKVLEEAIREWDVMFSCDDGKTVPIKFICDDTLPAGTLGVATVWFKADGDVEKAEIKLKNAALVWNLKEPGDWGVSGYDALSVAKHEVGHALGFIHGGNFLKKVKEVGGDRFYDMNDNGVKDDGDFDLEDGAGWDGHAASNTDLMYKELPKDTRRHPSWDHASVLADAYGYCIPEPVTVAGLLLGLGTVVGYIRRRAA